MHLVPGKVFANATDRNKIQSFINKSKRNGYCSPDLPDFNNLCTSVKVDVFNKVLKIPIHPTTSTTTTPVSHTQRYGLRVLRPRIHDRTLPEKSSNLVDCNFIIRMLYLNAYWLNNGLFMLLVCYVLLYVVALCVKMRCVILCIKRLLIDWLIDWLINQGCSTSPPSEAQCTRNLGLGYKLCAIIPVAVNAQWRTTFRALTVTFQVSTPGAESAVYDCLVRGCTDHFNSTFCLTSTSDINLNT